MLEIKYLWFFSVLRLCSAVHTVLSVPLDLYVSADIYIQTGQSNNYC